MSDKVKTYEAMFLTDAGTADFDAASEPVRNILTRYGAEVLSLRLWDDRRLAHEIGRHKRGLYLLAYIKADPARVVEIEHDCQLNEKILRVLILRRDRLSEQEINAPTPAMTASRPPEARPSEGPGPAPQRPAEPAVAEAAPEVAEEQMGSEQSKASE